MNGETSETFVNSNSSEFGELAREVKVEQIKVRKMFDVNDTIQAHGGAGVHSDLPLAGFYAYARSSSLPVPLTSKLKSPLPFNGNIKMATGTKNRVFWLIIDFWPNTNFALAEI